MNGARPEYIGGVFADFPTKAASDNNANPNGVMVVAPATETVFAHNLLIGTVGEDPSYGRQILQTFRDYKRETSGFEDEPWSSGFLRELIRKQLQAGDHLILLDEHGAERTSVAFASWLQKRMAAGARRLVLVVGGPYGFAPEIHQLAKEEISLSQMTFSHQMVRAFFVEQLYRAHSILRGEPYHHE